MHVYIFTYIYMYICINIFIYVYIFFYVPQENGINKNRKWHVCCRFIMDCDIFNEWGNEIDYESLPEGEDDNDDGNDDGNNASSPVKSGAARKVRGIYLYLYMHII
jgi:hypothetical protein